MRKAPAVKIRWQGVLTSVQPRIRLTRSFDERSPLSCRFYKSGPTRKVPGSVPPGIAR